MAAFQGSCDEPIRQWRIESLPFAMAFSRDDHYIALKFAYHLQLFDPLTKGTIHHQLPCQNSRSGRSNHLVTFSHDSLSIIASTRYEPEKVITYWSECTNPSRSNKVESSAPFVSDIFLSTTNS